MSSLNNVNDTKTHHNGNEMKQFEEIRIPVPWGYINGIWWGSSDIKPIIALHGWQDNAGTFWKLAPLLSKGVSVLSIDLPGHGYSSHFPPGQFYYIFWEGVIILRRIVKHYKWDKNDDFTFFKQKSLFTGKWWGPNDVQPIVTLHGRQDNSGTFDRLIPLLKQGISYLCLDMPGHGLSSHLYKGQFYFVHWEGIILLRRVVKHYNWNKVKLLGHSLGGAISFLYASAYPNEVEFVISLDIASPSVKDITKTVSITGDHIDKFLKYENLSLDNVPCYEYSEMIDVVENAYKGSITRDSAEILMKRGMQPALIPSKHYFSRDPRLKVSLLGMLSLDLVMAYAAEIKCAYLNIRAIPGMKFDQPENYQKVLEIIKQGARKFEYHEVEGTHHVHLNNPERVAPIINNFISSL